MINQYAEKERMTRLKDDISLLCEEYMAEHPIGLRAHGVMNALLYNTAVFKGAFDAQGFDVIDDELRRIIVHTESLSRQSTLQSLNRMEVENGTSGKS